MKEQKETITMDVSDFDSLLFGCLTFSFVENDLNYPWDPFECCRKHFPELYQNNSQYDRFIIDKTVENVSATFYILFHEKTFKTPPYSYYDYRDFIMFCIRLIHSDQKKLSDHKSIDAKKIFDTLIKYKDEETIAELKEILDYNSQSE